MSGVQKKNIIDGDLIVSGTVHASGVNSPGISHIVSKVAATEGTMEQVKITMPNVGIYVNNTPPTNNPTNLQFEVQPNSDGSFNLVVAFDYIQGDVPADGFLVYYKSSLDSPGDIDMLNDPAVFVAWDNS